MHAVGDGDLVSLDVSRYESEESSGKEHIVFVLNMENLTLYHLSHTLIRQVCPLIHGSYPIAFAQSAALANDRYALQRALHWL